MSEKEFIGILFVVILMIAIVGPEIGLHFKRKRNSELYDKKEK